MAGHDLFLYFHSIRLGNIRIDSLHIIFCRPRDNSVLAIRKFSVVHWCASVLHECTIYGCFNTIIRFLDITNG